MDKGAMNAELSRRGGQLHHIGMLVRNLDKAVRTLEATPGIGPVSRGESVWPAENMVVGPANAMRSGMAKLFDGLLLEVIEPVAGKCDGTHFEEYLASSGEGMHHVAYFFSNYGDYESVYRDMRSAGYADVQHGRIYSPARELTDEYCYMKSAEGGIIFELDWAKALWGY